MGAVIFDMDGVLIDSEPHWRAAEIEVLAALGVPITHDACEQTMGLRIDAVIQYWFDQHPWAGPSVAEVTELVIQGVAARIRTNARVLPAISALRAVDHSGERGAIATSSPHAVIDAVFERLYIDRRVWPVCSAEDEAHGKPDPAVYLSAAKAIRMPPERCMAIEDSLPGVQAAKAAGMRVVAVQPVDGADEVVPGDELALYLNRHWFYK